VSRLSNGAHEEKELIDCQLKIGGTDAPVVIIVEEV